MLWRARRSLDDLILFWTPRRAGFFLGDAGPSRLICRANGDEPAAVEADRPGCGLAVGWSSSAFKAVAPLESAAARWGTAQRRLPSRRLSIASVPLASAGRGAPRKGFLFCARNTGLRWQTGVMRAGETEALAAEFDPAGRQARGMQS